MFSMNRTKRPVVKPKFHAGKNGAIGNIATQFLRAKGLMLLPPEGGWVALVGNPYAPRGLRLPSSFRPLDIQHMDLYYAYDEECPWPEFDRQLEEYLPDFDAFNVLDVDEAIYQILGGSLTPREQLTWMTINTPHSQLVRVYRGEVRPFSQDLIEEMLEIGGLEIKPFAKVSDSPVWDEATRDIIGSLMLDGLSKNQAQAELVKAGELKAKDVSLELPGYFYRSAGMIRNQFCEELSDEELDSIREERKAKRRKMTVKMKVDDNPVLETTMGD